MLSRFYSEIVTIQVEKKRLQASHVLTAQESLLKIRKLFAFQCFTDKFPRLCETFTLVEMKHYNEIFCKSKAYTN